LKTTTTTKKEANKTLKITTKENEGSSEDEHKKWLRGMLSQQGSQKIEWMR
jgi:hypothetical protein